MESYAGNWTVAKLSSAADYCDFGESNGRYGVQRWTGRYGYMWSSLVYGSGAACMSMSGIIRRNGGRSAGMGRGEGTADRYFLRQAAYLCRRGGCIDFTPEEGLGTRVSTEGDSVHSLHAGIINDHYLCAAASISSLH